MNSVARESTRAVGVSSGTPMAAARSSASDWLSRGLARQTRWLNWMLALPLLLFLSAPLFALFLRIPLERLIPNLSNPQVHNAIRLSLSTTAITVAICVGYLPHPPPLTR